MGQKKTDHDRYADAKKIAKYFRELEPNDPEFVDKLHAMASRCLWCQENFNTWLLVRINKQLAMFIRKLDQRHQPESVSGSVGNVSSTNVDDTRLTIDTSQVDKTGN